MYVIDRRLPSKKYSMFCLQRNDELEMEETFLLIVFVCWTDVILYFEYVLKYRKKSTVLMIVSNLPGDAFQGN